MSVLGVIEDEFRISMRFERPVLLKQECCVGEALITATGEWVSHIKDYSNGLDDQKIHIVGRHDSIGGAIKSLWDFRELGQCLPA